MFFPCLGAVGFLLNMGIVMIMAWAPEILLFELLLWRLSMFEAELMNMVPI
jgi:hypothetical protein